MKPLHGNEVIRSNWSALWWVLGSVCMPLTLPFMLSNVLSQLRSWTNRDYLRNKVCNAIDFFLPLIVHCNATILYSGRRHNGRKLWLGRGDGAHILLGWMPGGPRRSSQRRAGTSAGRFAGDPNGNRLLVHIIFFRFLIFFLAHCDC